MLQGSRKIDTIKPPVTKVVEHLSTVFNVPVSPIVLTKDNTPTHNEQQPSEYVSESEVKEVLNTVPR